MPHSYGTRARTRGKFSKNFGEHGMPGLSTYLRNYKLGDYVDIVVDGAVHKGMPYQIYHGKTGRVWNVAKRSVGVEVNRLVRNRLIRKRLYVRVEHVRPSKCQQDFLARKELFAKIHAQRAAEKKEGKKELTPFPPRRLPPQPKEGGAVEKTEVVTLTPARYVNLF